MKNQDQHSSSEEQIRDLLSNLKVGYDKSSWSVLMNKLDAQSNMEETDRLFKDSLSSFQANYIPSSWAILQDKMDHMIYNRRHLIRLKVAELVLLFFMFWFWWGNGTDMSNISRPDLTETVNQKIRPINKEGEITKKSTYPSAIIQTQNLPSSSLPNETLKTQSSPIGYSKNFSKDTKELINGIPPQSLSAATILPASKIWTNKSAGNFLSVNIESNEAPIRITKPLVSKVEMFVQSMNKNNASFDGPIDRNNPDDKSHLIKVKAKKPLQYWISGAISYDKDLIRTPFPSQQSVNHLGRVERNYHGEINLFISNGMLEFQTGIGFWAKEYQSVYEGINDAMVLSIPANLRLRLSQRGFMRGYLMGGIATNFVAYANYNETAYFKEFPNNSIIENNYQARPSTIFSSSGYDHGIFEGESVKGNQYFTANMGIGVDIPINSIFSIYMEQVYFHHLSGGIGPAFDKFSTSSTIIGLRYLMNRKAARPGLNF